MKSICCHNLGKDRITIAKYINVEWGSDVIYVHVIHFGHFYSS